MTSQRWLPARSMRTSPTLEAAVGTWPALLAWSALKVLAVTVTPGTA